jgi:hypothetical protein
MVNVRLKWFKFSCCSQPLALVVFTFWFQFLHFSLFINFDFRIRRVTWYEKKSAINVFIWKRKRQFLSWRIHIFIISPSTIKIGGKLQSIVTQNLNLETIKENLTFLKQAQTNQKTQIHTASHVECWGKTSSTFYHVFFFFLHNVPFSHSC